jgi:hypothetical protein
MSLSKFKAAVVLIRSRPGRKHLQIKGMQNLKRIGKKQVKWVYLIFAYFMPILKRWLVQNPQIKNSLKSLFQKKPFLFRMAKKALNASRGVPSVVHLSDRATIYKKNFDSLYLYYIHLKMDQPEKVK